MIRKLSHLLVLAAVLLALPLVWQQPAFELLRDRLVVLAQACAVPALIAAAAVSCGMLFVPLSLVSVLTIGEVILLAFGCGSALLSCATLIAGMLAPRLLCWIAVALALNSGLVRGAMFFRIRRAAASSAPQDSPPRSFGLSAGMLVLLAAASLLIFVAALSPPLLYDVTEYHLGALKHYLATGIVAMPYNFFARFPFAVEALYYLGLVLEHAHDFSPKLLNAMFILASAMLPVVWLRRAGLSSGWQMLGAFLWLAHPVMLEVSLDAYIDAPVAFFTCLSLYAFVLAEGILPQPSTPLPQLLPAAGLLAGMALASKYTVAQIYLVPALLLFAAGACRTAWKNGKRLTTAAALLFALVPLCFWLGKNVWFYGNPLEPFFESVFRPQDAVAIAREKFYIRSHGPQSFFSAQYWQTLPLRAGSFGWILLAPVAGVPLARNRAVCLRILGLCATAFLLWNLVRYSQDRFLLPAIMLLIVAGVEVLAAMPGRIVGVLIGGIMVLISAGALWLHAARMANGGEFTYLQTFQPCPRMQDKAGIQFYRANLGPIGEVATSAAAGLPARAKLLLVYEARPYLFPRDCLYNTVFDDSVLLKLADGAGSGQEIQQRLRASGITHVIVNREELRRLIDQYSRPWLPPALRDFDAQTQFAAIPAPEDYYPPFHNSAQWQRSRAAVLEFLQLSRAGALLVKGRPDQEVWLSPV